MNIDWYQLLWDGRWTALEILWSAVVVSVTSHWWFGPLLLVIVLCAGWTAVRRFGAYVARVFGHTHGVG